MQYFAETQVLKINPDTPSAEIIRKAAKALRSGKLVVFPTETVYGLGANALDRTAIDRIYSAKQRPAGDPVIAHIHDVGQMETLTIKTPATAYKLAESFWPGPLTLVLCRAPGVPANIATGRETIAIRMPSHPVARALLSEADIPIAAPSANTFTRPSATTAAHVLQDLDGRVDIILDGGSTTIGLESTVLDLTGERPVVLRPGGLIMEDLLSIAPDVILSPGYVKKDAHESSPGQMLKHYSPRAEVMLFSGTIESMLQVIKEKSNELISSGRKIALLIADEDRPIIEQALADAVIVISLGSDADMETIGHNLFAGLRDLDEQGVDVILTRDFGREGIGAALWDRLLRAAEGKIIEA